MKQLKFVILIVIIFASGIGIGYFFGYDIGFEKSSNKSISSFEECVKAGNAVAESYPRQCSANGETFVEDIGNRNEKADLIVVNSPQPNETIKSPLVIEGSAKGTWFFEASFPVLLLDSDGREIASGIASAEGEWMTEEFVDFTSELIFTAPRSERGELVLMKDNPSNLPENDDKLSVPVSFQ